jgi:hypothetical protein
VAFNRYIMLIGGYPYDAVLRPDGTTAPTYGKPTKHYPEKGYYSDVFVYDTQTESFGTATGLPLNNNGPTTIVENDRIHLLGGETAGAEIEGDLYLVGTIRENKD